MLRNFLKWMADSRGLRLTTQLGSQLESRPQGVPGLQAAEWPFPHANSIAHQEDLLYFKFERFNTSRAMPVAEEPHSGPFEASIGP